MPSDLKPVRVLLKGPQMRRVVRRIAHEIAERDRGLDKLLLLGIRTRGVPLAEAIRREILASEGVDVPIGVLDITLYRDDLSLIAPQPVVKGTEIPGDLDGVLVVLCDDVLYTGRTIRAALDALIDFGRPRAVQLAVLIDRGHRELPIQADYVGKSVPTRAEESIEVHFEETDGEDQVLLVREGER